MLRLKEGPVLLVSFTRRPSPDADRAPITLADATGATRQVEGTFAALSFDEGRSWPHIKLVPRDPTKPDAAEAGGYLSCVQTPDGIIHLISSRCSYRFNLAWLKAD